ncbi:MAG TPA: hypothetical protein VK762_04105 [Polyangiaceae bacterium]|jgi:hypothetical protein|nr:hypothetical protein [Polyangiaceae bacterium]
MSDSRGAREDSEPELLEEHVLRVRLGHGANCSSMGSVIDTLFATAVVGAAVFAAIAAALSKEEVRVAGRDPGAARTPRRGPPSAPPEPEDAP